MKHISSVRLLAMFCFITALGGCTSNMNLVKPSKLQVAGVSKKIPLNVELRLTDEYRDAKWEYSLMGSTSRLPFGEHLVTNTVELAKSLFSEVIITTPTGPNGLAAPMPARCSAILLPRLVYVDITRRFDSYTTMALEWSLYDSSKKLVWVDSFRSEVKGLIEGVKDNKSMVQRQFDLLLEGLLKQSGQAMLSSPEIREFVESVGR
jgi:hypothetical protein